MPPGRDQQSRGDGQGRRSADGGSRGIGAQAGAPGWLGVARVERVAVRDGHHSRSGVHRGHAAQDGPGVPGTLPCRQLAARGSAPALGAARQPARRSRYDHHASDPAAVLRAPGFARRVRRLSGPGSQADSDQARLVRVDGRATGVALQLDLRVAAGVVRELRGVGHEADRQPGRHSGRVAAARRAGPPARRRAPDTRRVRGVEVRRRVQATRRSPGIAGHCPRSCLRPCRRSANRHSPWRRRRPPMR